MIWIFMLVLGAAATFTALGMFAVWVKVLTFALMGATVIVLGLLVILLLRRFIQK